MNLVILLFTMQLLPDSEMSLNFSLRSVRMLMPKARTGRPHSAAPYRRVTLGS